MIDRENAEAASKVSLEDGTKGSSRE